MKTGSRGNVTKDSDEDLFTRGVAWRGVARRGVARRGVARWGKRRGPRVGRRLMPPPAHLPSHTRPFLPATPFSW